jgi:hypothetical protein
MKPNGGNRCLTDRGGLVLQARIPPTDGLDAGLRRPTLNLPRQEHSAKIAVKARDLKVTRDTPSLLTIHAG